MDNRQEIATILEELYFEVNQFDLLQEQLTDICFCLDKLDNEKELYEKLDINKIFDKAISCIKKEKSNLLLKKKIIENKLSKINLNHILNEISFYESKNP